MFGRDIIAWGLHEDGSKVVEVHLLKDRSLWIGPRIPKWQWERGQKKMWNPYPASLRKPVDILLMEAK